MQVSDNQPLSQEVVEYLEDGGFNVDRITVRSSGVSVTVKPEKSEVSEDE